jgi:PIN domain nuclease of toxin-antitoxin system
MNLLLDTNIFLWLSQEPDRLSPAVRVAVTDNANRRFLSVVSIWEIEIKFSIGKLELGGPVKHFVEAHQHLLGSQSIPVFEHHIWTLAGLPIHHRDPFDRLLIAQAIAEDYMLVTADFVFSTHPVSVLM